MEEHFLICPIEHYQCSVGQPEDVLHEIKHVKSSLYEYFAKRDEIPIFMERNYKTSHMQIQCIPVPKLMHEDLLELFQVS